MEEWREPFPRVIVIRPVTTEKGGLDSRGEGGIIPMISPLPDFPKKADANCVSFITFSQFYWRKCGGNFYFKY